MPDASRNEGSTAQRPQRSRLGNILFGVGALAVLATMTLGAFAGVLFMSKLADASPFSAMVPDHGHTALVVGGIAAGGVIGLTLPTILFGMVRGGDQERPVGPRSALLKVLALILFGVYLLVGSIVVSQVGWIFPQGVTTLVAVFAIGFSWMPLAMVPWEKVGLGGVVGDRFGSHRSSGSQQAD
ncbi:MAG: hypothetical protein JF597_50245 [Streptomyces sp.]|jgi:hypothetical protein|uniref:hypothetical protein n=1 Tax=Streptomyces sp. TaxID=1931 RepID=UPI0025CF044B|nr:hypothetical protein [Streptomyces sp.]MBW8801439.1 hypothetical protein [Streptomyces sp.]